MKVVRPSEPEVVPVPDETVVFELDSKFVVEKELRALFSVDVSAGTTTGELDVEVMSPLGSEASLVSTETVVLELNSKFADVDKSRLLVESLLVVEMSFSVDEEVVFIVLV
jgi:hypothetical protein